MSKQIEFYRIYNPLDNSFYNRDNEDWDELGTFYDVMPTANQINESIYGWDPEYGWWDEKLPPIMIVRTHMIDDTICLSIDKLNKTDYNKWIALMEPQDIVKCKFKMSSNRSRRIT